MLSLDLYFWKENGWRIQADHLTENSLKA
jgi:hypothetical protein